MKKSLLLFTLLLPMLVCCSKVDSGHSRFEEPICDIGTSSFSISEEQALCSLDSLVSVLYGDQTKGPSCSRFSIASIEPIRAKDLKFCTKASALFDSDFDGDLLYLVNFSDSCGYAVLAATTALSDNVLCVTERGSISKDDLMNAVIDIESSGDDDEVITKSYSHEEDIVDIGIQIVPELIVSSVYSDINYGKESSSQYEQETKASPSGTKYGPLLKTKWGQTTIGDLRVYNRYIPCHAAAGCVTIATAQILVHNNAPNNGLPVYGYYCTWNHLETVYNYDDIDSEDRDTTAYERLAWFLRYIAEEDNLDIDFGTSEGAGSGGNATGVKRTLKNIGYSTVRKRTGFGSGDQDIATTKIRCGLPVYLDGSRSEQKGHAWVLDGECGSYYHINWGWDGYSDGYYAKGVFNIGARYGRDEVYDTETGENTQRNYTWNFRMVHYEL